MLRLLCAALSLVTLAPVARADATVALPFANLSNDKTLDWIGESVAENIQEALHAEGLVVLDRIDRVEAYQRLALNAATKLSRASIVKIGDELDASHVVFGNYEILREGNGPETKRSIRLKARVLDLKKLRQTAEFEQFGLLEDLAALQNRLAWATLSGIVPQPPENEAGFQSRRPAVRIDAMENYIRGLLSKNDAQRHRYFTQAARIEPNYSQPTFQLGRHYWDKEDYQHASEWFQKVATRDVHYFESLYYYGICRQYLADFAGAEVAFSAVAANVPLNEVFSNLGAAQLRQEKLAQAIANFEKALEGDDADPDYHFNLGLALWHAKRFDDAADRFRAVLERIRDDEEATTLLGFCLKKEPPRLHDRRFEGLERVKEQYQETVFRQLKSMLEKK